jgi:hypothetical protein
MANDREFIIQALITAGKVLKITDIDPKTTYLQVGVWQDNQQKAGSPNNAYPSLVIPLSELLVTGPKAFRALVTDNPGGGPPLLNVLEDTLSEGAGYSISITPAGAGKCYELKFTNGVLTASKTALPSNGLFAGLVAQDFSGNFLQAPEVFYSRVDKFTVGFCAFNLGGPGNTGFLNDHYLEIIVFP